MRSRARPPGRSLALAAMAAAALAFAPAASGLDVTVAVGGTSEYTSNTLRTEDDEIAEWIHEPGVDLGAAHDSASLELAADYSFVRRIYQKDYWGDENRTVGTANAVWHALPERLDFNLSNYRTESTIQAITPLTPDNRQVVSTTEAGATLMFQPRSADDLEFEYQFVDIRSDDTNTDSTRHNGFARYDLGLSANRLVRLEGMYSDISYDGLFPNADYWRGTIGYQQQSNRVDVNVYLGYNGYDREGRGSTSDPAYGATIDWRVTPTSSLQLVASREITDQSGALTGGATAGDVNENTGINAAFEETTGELTYLQVIGRTNLTLSGFWTEEQYADDIPLSNDRLGVRVGLSRDLTRTTSAELGAEFSQRDYDDLGDDQDEIRARVQISHEIGRRIEFNWGARFEKRDAEVTQSYDEWIGFLQLYYTLWGA